MERRRDWLDGILATECLALLLVALISNFSGAWGEQQYSYLARSFLHGKTYFLEAPGGWDDTAAVGGHHYWPQGPLPAVLLAPFVGTFDALGIFFHQGYLAFWLVLGVVALCYLLARRLGFDKLHTCYLTAAFCFGSPFLAIALVPWAAWLAQLTTVLFLLLAIREYMERKRSFWIGSFLGLAMLGRTTAGLGIVFFVLVILAEGGRRWRALAGLLVPVLVAGAGLAAYNTVRFGSVFEHGYSYQILASYFEEARGRGLFGLAHLPGNLYRLLLAGPEPVFREGIPPVLQFPFVKADPWGMSIFLTAPYLMRLCRLRTFDTESKAVLIAVGCVAAPILFYYGIGARQLGYRYALDFLPFLHFLLLRRWEGEKVLSSGFRALIVASVALNLFFAVTMFVQF